MATAQRHAVVGGGGRVDEEVAPLDSTGGADLDEAAAAARIVAFAAVAQTALIEMEDGDGEGGQCSC